jgi:hypothetical protein
MVIIGIDYIQTLGGGISGALLFAHQVLLIGINVRIAVVDGGLVAVGQHPLNDGSAAWGTAGM